MRQFTSDFKWNLKRGLHGAVVHAVINVQKGLIYLLYMVPVGLLLFAFFFAKNFHKSRGGAAARF